MNARRIAIPSWSAVYVTWAEGRESPREIRGPRDKTAEE